MHVHPVLGEPTMMLAFEGWNDACEAASSVIRFVDGHLRGVPLAEIDPESRSALKKAGLLTRDPRKKESKKYGLKKARKAPQYSKR